MTKDTQNSSLMMNRPEVTFGTVEGIISNLLIIKCNGPVGQNEICHIKFAGKKLAAEVIRVSGNQAFAQVFDSTRGLKPGTPVEFTGHLLEINLGPGMLSRKYDGLQNDLEKLEGVFLERGAVADPLDATAQFDIQVTATVADAVYPGKPIAETKEGWLTHKIMVPFDLHGDDWKLSWLTTNGSYRVDDHIATITNSRGSERKLTMRQKWPIKIAMPGYREKLRPYRLLETGVRIIDTFNPMAEGGAGFIPGPFGCGKTVLQHSLSKYAAADVIIVAACGERANEVVELFTEFPELDDPRTGRKLMERTVIICNTSNMPVAAREASVYTGMTIAEYYRAMGLKVLLLADSTSRWAQALREMSNRLEELPGPDAFPIDLPAVISNFYSRAGFVNLHDGNSGSVTFVGTVSPAGGNLKEPVTESTKKVARCFYALNQSRADARRYPAVDPLDSYSKYLEYPELVEHLAKTIEPGWVDLVIKARDYLRRGREAYDQMNILGDDSVPVEYHLVFWKSELIDFVFLQQDAFDAIDCATSMRRQSYMLNLIMQICERDFDFKHYGGVASYFKSLINVLKQMNYSEFESDDFQKFGARLEKILKEHTEDLLATPDAQSEVVQ